MGWLKQKCFVDLLSKIWEKNYWSLFFHFGIERLYEVKNRIVPIYSISLLSQPANKLTGGSAHNLQAQNQLKSHINQSLFHSRFSFTVAFYTKISITSQLEPDGRGAHGQRVLPLPRGQGPRRPPQLHDGRALRQGVALPWLYPYCYHEREPKISYIIRKAQIDGKKLQMSILR